MITLKTLAQATAQQVYDQVALHLLKQNARSLKDGKCMYRGDNGTKCAAGCLIDESEYSSIIEDISWNDLNVPQVHDRLISSLQNMHDCGSVADWPDQLRQIAGWYHLNADVVDNFNK